MAQPMDINRIAAFLFLAAALWRPDPALALQGRVVRENGSPVVDAAISIVGLAGSARTDRQGLFRWEPDPELPFEVLVALSSGQYLAPVLIQELPADGPLLIRVPAVVQDTITVTSGATPNIEAPAANGTTLVGAEELNTRQPIRLVDAIETIAGVSRTSDGQSAVPVIRGLARGRTLILIDSGRVTTERRVGSSAGFLDPFFLQGVEVARGPGSVAYGSDAFGGVIHARTRRPEPDSPLRFRFQGVLGAGWPERDVGVEVSQGFRNGGVLFLGGFRQFEDYDSPLGKVDNSGARNRSFLARVNHEVGPGQLTVGFQWDQGRDIGRPRNNSNVTRFFYPREDSGRFTASYDLDPVGGFSRLTIDFFAGSYRLVTFQESLPREDRNRAVELSDVDANDYGLRALAVRPLANARLEFGVDLNGRFGLFALDEARFFDSSDRLDTVEPNVTIEDARRTDSAVYANLEWQPTGLWTLAGGVRLDRLTSRNRAGFFGDRSTSETAVSGYASLAVQPISDLRLTGQISRGFRDAGLSDRYFRGISGRGFITGNPDLEPESSLQLDFAARYAAGPTRWSFFLYRYRIDDLIERFEVEEDLFFFRNRDRARLRGVELEVSWELTEDLKLVATAQKSDGITLSDRADLDDIAADSVSLALRQAIGESGYLHLRGEAFARADRPGPGERVAPGYGTLDLGGGWRLQPQVWLRFHLRNLLDKDYLLSPDRRTVLAPGRSGTVTLALSL